MDKPEHTPKDITVEHSEQLMRIEWADGHTSEYNLQGLRKACPCVTCRGGHEQMGEPVDIDWGLYEDIIDVDRKIDELEVIGNHALKITWGDGHNTGMYRWDYLRNLCPCEECQA